MKRKKYFIIGLISGLLLIGGLVLFAFARTYGKTDMEFRIHINKELVQQSTFGESPTFAIWIENPETKNTQTIFVTKRAALGDWEGKASVPVALPKWFEVFKKENNSDDIPTTDNSTPDAISGATPKPGYFSTQIRVTPKSEWNCYIEVNLAGDFNEYFQQYNEEEKTTDEYSTGQPSLLYKAKITAEEGNQTVPELIGMCTLNSINGEIVQPIEGITSASNIFDEILISVIKPKPRIIEWKK